MQRKSVVLVGFQGVGKTTFGRKIALRTGREFVDTDEKIEEHFGGESVRSLQRRIGTKQFREEEKKIIEGYKGINNILLATGGGVVEIEGSRKILEEVGKVYFLYLPLEKLLPRFEKEGVYHSQKDPLAFFSHREKLYMDVCDTKIEALWDQILLEDNLR